MILLKGEGGVVRITTIGTILRADALALLLLSLPAFGQSNYANLSGVVLDPQQSVLAGANVELTSVNTHAIRRVTTNQQGLFEISGLPPGNYELRVQSPGFAVLFQTLRLEVG